MRPGRSPRGALGVVAALLVAQPLGCGQRERDAGPVVSVTVSAAPIDFDLPEFALKDQHGRAFTRRDLDGKVWVVDFVFTSCPTICPELTQRMAWLVGELEAEPGVSFLSVSVDPETDTPERLVAFQKKHGRESPRWFFVTGDPAVVEKTVLEGFKMALSRGGGHGDANIFHAERFLVLDKRGHVRGVFDSKGEGLVALQARARELNRE